MLPSTKLCNRFGTGLNNNRTFNVISKFYKKIISQKNFFFKFITI